MMFGGVDLGYIRHVDHKTVLLTTMQNDLFLTAFEDFDLNPNITKTVMCQNIIDQFHQFVLKWFDGGVSCTCHISRL